MVALVSRRKEKKMIDRAKVIKALERCLICDISVVATPEAQKAYLECEYTIGRYCGRKNVLRDALSLLKEQPEIVRCKDCKWAEVSDNEHTWCDHVDHEFCHNNDWFCADGEART